MCLSKFIIHCTKNGTHAMLTLDIKLCFDGFVKYASKFLNNFHLTLAPQCAHIQ